MADIGSLVVSLQARTDTLERQLNRANGMIRKLQRETRGIGDASRRAERVTTRAFARMRIGARGLTSQLIATSRSMRALAIAGGAFLAGGFIVRTIQATDELGKFAQRIGIAVESLQALEFAASQSGIAQNVFQLGLQRIIRRAQDAVRGNAQLADSFAEVGLSLRELQTLSNEEIFRRAITGAAELETGLAAIQKIADTEGVALIQLGQQGAAGIAALEERARRLGIVLNESIVQRAAAANDQLDIMRRVISTRLIVAVSKLLPLIQRFGESFTRVVEALVVGTRAFQNLSKNEASLVRFLSSLRDILAQTVPLATQLFGLLQPILDKLIQLQVAALSFVNQGLERFTNWLDRITNQAPKASAAISNIDRARGGRRSERAREMEITSAIESLASGRLRQAQQQFRLETQRLQQQAELTAEVVGGAFQSISQTIQQSTIGVLRGTQSMSQALRNFVSNLGASLLSSTMQRILSVLGQLALNALVPGGGTLAGAGASAAVGAGASTVGGLAVRTATPALGAGFQARAAVPDITMINVASRQEAQELAIAETARGRNVTINDMAADIMQRGSGSPLVQAFNAVQRR